IAYVLGKVANPSLSVNQSRLLASRRAKAYQLHKDPSSPVVLAHRHGKPACPDRSGAVEAQVKPAMATGGIGLADPRGAPIAKNCTMAVDKSGDNPQPLGAAAAPRACARIAPARGKRLLASLWKSPSRLEEKHNNIDAGTYHRRHGAG